MSLTLRQLQQANADRNADAYPDFRTRFGFLYWCTALASEVGEVADLVKKAHRIGDDPEHLRLQLGAELADVVTYCLLFAEVAGIDLELAVADKFDVVSERLDVPKLAAYLRDQADRGDEVTS